MAITLHRFPLSHFSEKGRALLDFKELDYAIVEHKLGLPQIGIWRLSGQRQVPVIVHDGKVVHDSTVIALYLERNFPDRRPLLPKDEQRRKEVLALEDEIDRVLGFSAVVAWYRWVVSRPEAARMLDLEVFGIGNVGGRGLAALSRALVNGPARAMAERATDKTRRFLGGLCDRLEKTKYLVGDEPTLADVAAAGLSLHLEFPRSRHFPLPELQGMGVPGIADDPELARFFEWRRQFYRDYLR